MRFHISVIPSEVISFYNLHKKTNSNGWVYVRIKNALYGLKEAGKLANDDLKKNLARHRYIPVTHTLGLFRHITRPISFTLVTDDFGVKYVNKTDAEHLVNVISTYYPMTTDWSGKKYIGIDLDWNYEQREVRASMKGYVESARQKF